MKKQLKQVKEFHNAFGVKSEKSPVILPQQIWHLRGSLLEEELEEYKIRLNKADKIKKKKKKIKFTSKTFSEEMEKIMKIKSVIDDK